MTRPTLEADILRAHGDRFLDRYRSSFDFQQLTLGRQLLASSLSMEHEVRTHRVPSESSSLWHCPRCGTSMIVIQRFTAAELSACMYFDSS